VGAQFPDLFDEDDVRLAESQGRYGWHFVEWLAAIPLFHRTGYLSLISKYQFATHRRTHEIAKKVQPGVSLRDLRRGGRPIRAWASPQVCRSRMASTSHAASSAQESAGASGRMTNLDRPAWT